VRIRETDGRDKRTQLSPYNTLGVSSMPELPPDAYQAWDHSNANRSAIEAGGDCACFGCFTSFDASEVRKWSGNAAWCPKCEAVCTVLVAQAGFPLSRSYLEAVHDHWIGPQDALDAAAEKTHATAIASLKRRAESGGHPSREEPSLFMKLSKWLKS